MKTKGYLVLCLVLLIGMLSGCSSTTEADPDDKGTDPVLSEKTVDDEDGEVLQTEFEIALTNMESVESYRIDTIMENMPLFGTVIGYTLVEGNNTFTLFGIYEEYSFTLEGQRYYLEMVDGEYYASNLYLEPGDEVFGANIYEDFNSENFTKDEDGYYSSNIDYYEMTNVRVKIENDYISELIAVVNMEENIMNLTFTFSGYNVTEIDFPEYQMLEPLIPEN